MEDYVYKICPKDIWQAAVDEGVFKGSGIDLADGFIHFSAASQVIETAAKHYAGIDNLVLVRVATETIDLVWEVSRGGDLFPHLYGDLPLSAAVEVRDLPLSPSGQHIFPPKRRR